MSENIPKKPSPKDYIVSPDNKHVENLVWETVIMKNGHPYYQKWLFKREDFICGRCENANNTVFMATLTGVCRSCKYCGYTEHIVPVHPDTGDEMAYLIDEHSITVEEAWKLLEQHRRTKYPPSGLPKLKGGKRRKLPSPESIQ